MVALKPAFRVLAFLILFMPTGIGFAGPEFESPPIFSARTTLKPALISGPNFLVEERVRNDGRMNHYVLSSPFGTFQAGSKLMLEQRVLEVYALTILEEQYSSESVLYEAAEEAAEDIVTAPIRGIEKVGKTLTDPKKLVETIEALPQGVINLVEEAGEILIEGVASAYSESKRLMGRDEGEPSESFLTEQTLELIGYNKAYREIAAKLGVDPYTTNEVLRYELMRIAALRTSIKWADKFIPGLPSVPYVGDANRYIDQAKRIAAYEDPAQILKLHKKVLGDLLGQGEEQPLSQALLRNRFYTPSSRSVLLKHLSKLRGVRNLDSLIKEAATAKSEESSLYFISLAEKLAEYHSSRQRFSALFVKGFVTAGITADGHAVIPLPVDYMAWTKANATIFSEADRRLRQDHGVQSIEARVGTRLSPLAKHALRDLHVKLA